MAHVAPWKKSEVEDLVKLLKSSPVIGLAQVDGIPSAQMQLMRKSLRADAKVKISKNSLLALALKEAGRDIPGADKLVDNVGGSTAVIATSMNPFQLYRKIESAKTKAPARGGDTAPEDIRVPKGETPFKPGPIVGELQKVGIPAKIEGGKVVISAEKVVVKAGDKIPQEIAQALTRLEIFPMTVGMNLKAVYQKGMIFKRDVLSVDFLAEIIRGYYAARGVGVAAAYPTKGTIEPLLGKATRVMLAIARKASPEALDDDLKAKLDEAAAAAAAAPTAAAEEKPKEEEPEEVVSEEDAMGGLGSLFG